MVTGAANGIGRALALGLWNKGCHLALVDLDQDALASLRLVLTRSGRGQIATTHIANVGDRVRMEELACEVVAVHGAVHLLINNAGVAHEAAFPQTSLDDWERIVGVNLWGVIYGLHSFLPMLLANSDGGHVVNTASVAGLVAGAGIGPYNASKSAVVAISETLRKELDLSEAGVGVSVLCPGYVRTNIFESQRNRPEALRNPSRAAGDARVRNDALKRMLDTAMDPAEVAELVHDAVVEDRFWVITHAEFLKPIAERADEIVAGTNPRPGRFGE